jgi:hypothetical protein
VRNEKELPMYGVYVINKSLLSLATTTDEFSLYATFLLLFYFCFLFLQVKNVTPDKQPSQLTTLQLGPIHAG